MESSEVFLPTAAAAKNPPTYVCAPCIEMGDVVNYRGNVIEEGGGDLTCVNPGENTCFIGDALKTSTSYPLWTALFASTWYRRRYVFIPNTSVLRFHR